MKKPVRLPDRGRALAHRRPPGAHRPRPGVRGAGEAGADRRGHPQAGGALPRGALPAGRQERLRAVGRERRGRILEVPGQRRRQGRAAHLRRQGAPLGGGGLARRPLDRPSRQGASSSGCSTSRAASRSASPPRPRPTATSRTSPGRRTAAGSPGRWPAPTRSTGSTSTDVATGSDGAADHRPLQQHEPRLEPGRQVDLLPLRPQPAHPRPLPLGAAPARSLPDGDHRDLRHRPEEGHPLPLPAARRAASGQAQGRQGGRPRRTPTQADRGRQGTKGKAKEKDEGQGRRRGQGEGAAEGGDRSRRPRLPALRGPRASRQLRVADGGRGPPVLARGRAGDRRTTRWRSRRVAVRSREDRCPSRCSPTSRTTTSRPTARS